MRAKEFLQEAPEQRVAFSWGRFQPPHLGHAEVFKKLESVGNYGFWIGTGQTHDPKKNPLQYADKVAILKQVFPAYSDNILADSSIRTAYDAIVAIYKKYDPKEAENITLVFVGDPERINDFVGGFKKFNGVEARHGYYKFKDVVGFANTDKGDVRATDVRGAVQAKDMDKFQQLTGLEGKLAQTVFNKVAEGMGVV